MTASVEAHGPRWHKSSYSNGDGGNCVEIARPDGSLWVRDSKQHRGSVIAVDPEAWRAFTSQYRSNRAS